MVFESEKIKKNVAPVEVPTVPHKSYGKVPKYIDKFNKQRDEARQQQLLAEENAKLPPGTRLMPEDERQATLIDLNLAKKATND